MSPHQKAAWFSIAVFGASVLAYLVAVPVLAHVFEKPMSVAAVPALGVFGLYGLTGLSRRFYRTSSKEKVLLDERDHDIYRRANLTAFRVFWLFFVAACMTTWGVGRYVRHQETIPIDFAPMLVFAGMIVVLLTQSIAVLVLYGRGDSRA
jgi:hypothetical protein